MNMAPSPRHSFTFLLTAGLLLCGCQQNPAATPAGTEPVRGEPTPSGGKSAGVRKTSGATSDRTPAATPTAEGPNPLAIPAPIQKAVLAPDRTPEDRVLDAGRQPERTLAFFGIEPGMRVAELAAGTGYTAELLARVVGETGTVYGQNTPFILQRFAEEPWSARLEKPVMDRVVRIDTEMDAPLPTEAAELDAVLLILFYHDTVWFETDRAAMNRAIFEALAPGGVYGVVDHSARTGDGVKEAQNLHRIEESVLRAEIEAAGFVLEASADFLRNPADTRDWNASPSKAGERRGTSDRFVLRFRKPEED